VALQAQAALIRIRAKTLMGFRLCRAAAAILMAISIQSATAATGGVAVSTVATPPTTSTWTTTTSSPAGAAPISRACPPLGACKTEERSSAHSVSNGRCCEL